MHELSAPLSEIGRAELSLCQLPWVETLSNTDKQSIFHMRPTFVRSGGLAIRPATHILLTVVEDHFMVQLLSFWINVEKV